MMNALATFWKERNLHLSHKEATSLYGIHDFDEQLKALKSQGIPIVSETRYDLGESFKRYYLEESWREANR